MSLSRKTTLPIESEFSPLDLTPPPKTGSALVMSLIFHVIALVMLGWVWTVADGGTTQSDDRNVGIAMVHRMPDRDQYVDLAEPEDATATESSSTSATSSSAASAAAPPMDLSPPMDLDGILAAIEATPSADVGSGIAGQSAIDGAAMTDGTGESSPADAGQTTTMVFGVSGTGSQFVYVFDRSDSMNGFGGRPLAAAKGELMRSLGTLTERQRFQLIFYNDKPTPFQLSGRPMQMMIADETNVTLATRYINSINAFGATEHDTALRMALRLSPDVIFFLTDARIPRLSASELRDIQRRSQISGTTIHAIEFGPDPGAPEDSFLRDLAVMNNGQYQYVDVRRLGESIQENSGANP